MQPLKPCPFCGDRAELAQNIDADWWVFCVNDECKGNVGYFGTRDDALLAWGFRQPLHESVKP